MMKIRTLIVDDEPLARLNLSSLLETEADFDVVGQCADAQSAVRSLAGLQPQLVFLDIQMPGMNGFDVLGAARPAAPPAVVFVTAHDQFAVKAFEVDALDYLLKPFRRERFQHVLARARQRLQAGAAAPLGAVQAEPERMLVKCGNRFVFIAFAELDFIRAAANYVTLHVGSTTHDVRETLGDIELRLPPGRFLRLHRSYIVNLAALQSLEPVGGGDYVARLRTGRELPVGPSYPAAIRRALQHVPRFGSGTGL
jgi:two-component system LytT family response regulator